MAKEQKPGCRGDTRGALLDVCGHVLGWSRHRLDGDSVAVRAPSGPPPARRGVEPSSKRSPELPPPAPPLSPAWRPSRRLDRKRLPGGKALGEIEWGASGQSQTLSLTPIAFFWGGGGAQRLHLWEILPLGGLEAAASSCGWSL